MWQRLTMLLLAAVPTSWLGAHGSADAADGPSGSTYKPSSGPIEVRTIEKLVLEDARREKELQLRINVPSGKAPFPVIVSGAISGRIAWKSSARKRSSYATSKRYAADFGFRPLRATA